jgi:hypothetical protein
MKESIKLFLIITLIGCANEKKEDTSFLKQPNIEDETTNTILAQRAIPVSNFDDEVKNAYKILLSKKYFKDTELIRFKGLYKKGENTKYAKRLKKTMDSLKIEVDNIGKFPEKEKAEDLKWDIAQRKKYAQSLENELLDRGINARVSAYGKKYDKIKIKYSLFNAVWRRKFETLGYFDKIHAEGFNEILLTDGYDFSEGVRYD